MTRFSKLLCGNPTGSRSGTTCYKRAHVAPCTFLSRSRGSLRRSGVLKVCRGLPRACWRTWRRCGGDWVRDVAHTLGQRAFRVADCGGRACWEPARSVLAGRVGGAVGIGFGACRARADVTRCDMRFAWQAWDSGCMSALGKALEGGSAWQARGRRGDVCT